MNDKESSILGIIKGIAVGVSVFIGALAALLGK